MGMVITMSFDSQERRTEYKSVTNGTQNTWLRFLYDGYLCVQVLYSNEPYNVFKEFVWDPTEPVATRPLVFRYAPNSLNLFYAFDGNKNVSDVFYRMTSNGIGAHYDYAPFGTTTRTHRDSSASFDIAALNPFRFSSEYYDSELDLVYYNYRHYSPSLGCFLSRAPIEEQGIWNLYAFAGNNAILEIESLGFARLVLNTAKRLVKNYDSHIYGWTEGVWSTHHIPYLVCEKSKNGKYCEIISNAPSEKFDSCLSPQLRCRVPAGTVVIIRVNIFIPLRLCENSFSLHVCSARDRRGDVAWALHFRFGDRQCVAACCRGIGERAYFRVDAF